MSSKYNGQDAVYIGQSDDAAGIAPIFDLQTGRFMTYARRGLILNFMVPHESRHRLDLTIVQHTRWLNYVKLKQ